MSAIPEPSAVRFRAMSYADLNNIMAIEKQAYAFPWTATIFRDCIRVGYRCRLLEIEEIIEAYGVLSVAANEAHVLNLCVRPTSQNQGFARHMLGHLLDVARINVAKTIFLEVRPSNQNAINLYQSMGFCEIGVRRDYYPNHQGREDALVMGMSL
jgi:ribosomal-protein-alanine N-acetyltransferase